MIWAMGGGSGGGMIWANRSLVGQPPMLSLSLSWKSFEGKIESEMNLWLREFILQVKLNSIFNLNVFSSGAKYTAGWKMFSYFSLPLKQTQP